jgi:acyl-CoA synthetase (AMP-forming)/AMP-acid ligase II
MENFLPRLAEEIEEFKMPGQVVHLTKMPVNQNGKFDRKLLKEKAV